MYWMCGGEIKTDKLLQRLMATLKEQVYPLSGSCEVMHNSSSLRYFTIRSLITKKPSLAYFRRTTVWHWLRLCWGPLGSSLMSIQKGAMLIESMCLTRSRPSPFDMLTRSAWRTAEHMGSAHFVMTEQSRDPEISPFWYQSKSHVLKYVL